MEQVTKTVAALNDHGFSGKKEPPEIDDRNCAQRPPDISMFECLIRPHEVSTQQKPVNISHIIERLQEADVKREERRQRQIANAIIRNAAKRKREEESDGANKEPESLDQDTSSEIPLKRLKTEQVPSTTGSVAPTPVQQPSPSVCPPGQTDSEDTHTQTQVVSRVIPEVRGHTSYLTFAIKLPIIMTR
jgi:tRNA (adenine57-N1/adenine58-N1)-methyltransferase catalytic subunit